MPIQKDRSKDIPGKTGYSVRDRERLLDVAKNPGKYGVEPDYNDNGGDDKDDCSSKLFQFLLLAITFASLVS